MLLGIDDDVREMIEVAASCTDLFWSDGLKDVLTTHGNERAGVLSVLELWRENVLQTIDTEFGIELDWQTVRIDAASPLVEELIEAASPS